MTRILDYGRGGNGVCPRRKPKGRCEPLRRGFLNSPITREGRAALAYARLILLIAAIIPYLSLGSSANSQNVTDEAFYLSPTSIYFPSTYCGWDRKGLPEKYQQICRKYDNKFLEVGTHFHAEFLKKQREKAESGSGVAASEAEAVKLKRAYNPKLKIRGHTPEWVEIESDVGSIYSVDIKSIVHPYGHDPNKLMFDGAGQSPIGHRTKYVEAVILGPDYEFLWYQFNCKEYVYDIQARMFRIRISPRSVLAEISKVVCSR